jgi:hypothetical protein
MNSITVQKGRSLGCYFGWTIHMTALIVMHYGKNGTPECSINSNLVHSVQCSWKYQIDSKSDNLGSHIIISGIKKCIIALRTDYRFHNFGAHEHLEITKKLGSNGCDDCSSDCKIWSCEMGKVNQNTCFPDTVHFVGTSPVSSIEGSVREQLIRVVQLVLGVGIAFGVVQICK